MTKDRIDALLKGLDVMLALGVDGGGVVGKPQSSRNVGIFMSVIQLFLFDSG